MFSEYKFKSSGKSIYPYHVCLFVCLYLLSHQILNILFRWVFFVSWTCCQSYWYLLNQNICQQFHQLTMLNFVKGINVVNKARIHIQCYAMAPLPKYIYAGQRFHDSRLSSKFGLHISCYCFAFIVNSIISSK